MIRIVDINSYTEWQTVQIQISWLLQKPTDLDLHCLQKQDISGFSRTRVKIQRFFLGCLDEVFVPKEETDEDKSEDKSKSEEKNKGKKKKQKDKG